MGRSGADVVIVGAGVVGLSAALGLAHHGVAVVVIDRGQPGAGASGLNGGMVQHSEVNSGGLDSLLERRGLETYRWLAEVRGHDIGFRSSGCLVLIRTDDELDLARAQNADGAAEVLDPTQLRELEPMTAPDLLGAVRYPDAAQADPMAATLALAAEAERAGVTIMSGAEVRGIAPGAAGWDVDLVSHSLRCEQVVVATGAWLSALVPAVEVLPVRGQMWETAPTEHRLGHTIAAMESTLAWSRNDGAMRLTHPDGESRSTRHVYGRQRSNGTIAFGGDRFPLVPGAPVDVDSDGIETNHAHVRELLPGLGPLSITRTWAGLMPFTRDGLPVIGAVHDHPGLWVAGGLASNGFGRGPGAGHLIADLITAQPAIPELTTASPTRFT